jgi:hypothetical protein
MRDVSKLLKRSLFVLSVAFNAVLYQFLIVVVLGTFVFEGEMAEGPALLWFFSIPVTLMVSAGAAFTFDWYSTLAARHTTVRVYSAFVVAVGILGPILALLLTYAGLDLVWT